MQQKIRVNDAAAASAWYNSVIVHDLDNGIALDLDILHIGTFQYTTSASFHWC